jgi:hypothetical protein
MGAAGEWQQPLYRATRGEPPGEAVAGGAHHEERRADLVGVLDQRLVRAGRTVSSRSPIRAQDSLGARGFGLPRGL